MYKHIIFNDNDYYFNKEWAYKYMDNYNMDKKNVDKLYDLKNVIKYLKDKKLMEKDCSMMTNRLMPIMAISEMMDLIRIYQQHYILVAETNPAILKYYNPGQWWRKYREDYNITNINADYFDY